MKTTTITLKTLTLAAASVALTPLSLQADAWLYHLDQRLDINDNYQRPKLRSAGTSMRSSTMPRGLILWLCLSLQRMR
jgi:hypothetical protein